MGVKEYIIKIDEDKKDIMGDCPLVEKPKELVRCKDCKHFSFKDHWADVGQGVKVLCADHCPTCSKWSNGCKTDPEGYCFLAERADT